jgi:hypothetical protein
MYKNWTETSIIKDYNNGIMQLVCSTGFQDFVHCIVFRNTVFQKLHLFLIAYNFIGIKSFSVVNI